MMPTALAISPHLDDAVFSAGGMLTRLSRAGWRVIVATVFTASVPDPTGFALACQVDKGFSPEIDYMLLRRDEDATACHIIGAEPLWLPFAEAPHRGYESAAEIFAGIRGDDKIVDEIAPFLADLIERRKPDVIFAPQAIGAHVDHVALYQALRACRMPIQLWADFPYAMHPQRQPSPFENEFRRFVAGDVDLTVAEIRAKADAATSYTSQLGFQFGGAGQANEKIRSFGSTEMFVRLSKPLESCATATGTSHQRSAFPPV